MSTIKGFLSEDHGRCDELFAKMEDAVTQSIENAKEAYDAFAEATERHFQMEERVMFLEFEQKTGMTQGPTMVMRMEHSQMRNILEDLKADIEKKDKNHFFGVSESLMMLMQQHNMKEEQMLYKMADMHLGSLISKTIEDMKAL